MKSLEDNLEAIRLQMAELSLGGKPTTLSTTKPEPTVAAAQNDEEEDDDDVDLFGSDDDEVSSMVHF